MCKSLVKLNLVAIQAQNRWINCNYLSNFALNAIFYFCPKNFVTESRAWFEILIPTFTALKYRLFRFLTLIVYFATKIVQKSIFSLFHGKHPRNLLIVRNFLLDRVTIRSLLLKFDVNKTSSERQTPITLQTKQESNLLSFPWTRSKNRSWIFGDESAQREKPDLRKLWFVKWDVGVFGIGVTTRIWPQWQPQHLQQVRLHLQTQILHQNQGNLNWQVRRRPYNSTAVHFYNIQFALYLLKSEMCAQNVSFYDNM